jgi:hypothetical protein
MNTPSLLSFVFGLCLGAVGASAAVSLDGLATESPFMPKRDESAVVPVATENAAIEFRGLIATKDGVLFGLYDRSRNVGAWVGEKDRSSEFTVRSYDVAADMVTVEYQGQKYTLPLSTSRIATAAPSAPPVMAKPAQPGSPQAAAAVPADATRLESVAAEVRRRRALRQAAAQPGAAAAPANRTPAPAATAPAATPQPPQ